MIGTNLKCREIESVYLGIYNILCVNNLIMNDIEWFLNADTLKCVLYEYYNKYALFWVLRSYNVNFLVPRPLVINFKCEITFWFGKWS